MTPRHYDARVGYFNLGFEDYGSTEHKVDEIHYITRWRLEKKDPDAEVSEPIKPIVFYIGRGVPDKWRPWIKKGVEAWQPAFEAAGFKNAILAKDAPTEEEDPDWDAEDARYSTLQWLPSTIENARVRTSTIRAREKSSRRTFSSITTSSDCSGTGISPKSPRWIRGPNNCPCPMISWASCWLTS